MMFKLSKSFDVDFSKYQDIITKNHDLLHNKEGKGNDFLGWLDLPNRITLDELNKLKATARRIRDISDVVVITGIGGSYLAVRTAVEFLKVFKPKIEILYAGHNLSSTYMYELKDYLKDKDFSVVVISKSGTTTETAIAFRFLKELLNKYSNPSERIIAVTDAKKGALRKLADEEGYESYVIPNDVGGRYSILTPCGLLGMAIAGIDIDKIVIGARKAYNDLLVEDININLAYQYALSRNLLYKDSDKKVEILVNYDPKLNYFNEWWKQLFGESDGKDGLGIFPVSVSFSTDLHSLGQYIQEGERLFFETVINIVKPRYDIEVPIDSIDDGLTYLEGKNLDYVNKKAMEGTYEAHVAGGVEVITIDIPDDTEETFGYLVYFFMKACAMSGYIIGVNPFNQPGVEYYKKNMFKLLGKPGY